MEMQGIKWPQEIIEERVSNEAFLKIKLNRIDDLFSRLRPYLDSLCRLNGLADRKDIRDIIKYVLREFAAYFWDLPASRSYHHSGRWGLLHHSMEVALKRAEEASRRVAVDSEGNPSAESGKKYRGEQVLIAWLSGLFHDSGKVFDMDLVYSEASREVYYHPMRGNVLGFKLKHPDDGLKISWHQSRGMRHARYNLAMLMALIPLDLIQQLRTEQFAALIDKMIEDGDTADQESVAEARAEEDREYVREAIKLFARDGFRAQDKNGNTQPRVLALGRNTYVLVTPVALQALVRYCKKELGADSFNKDQVTSYLIRNGYIYSSDDEDSSGNYFIRIKGYIKHSQVSFHAIFANGDMFADVDVSGVGTLRLDYDEEMWEGIKRIIGFPPPYEWFHNPPAQQEAESEQQEPEEDEGAASSPDPQSDSLSGPDNDTDIDSGPDTDSSDSVPDGQNNDPVSAALRNFAGFLEKGEVTINNPDEERNIGFVSANDGYFWGYYAAPKKTDWSHYSQNRPISGTLFIKKTFRNTGIKNSMEAVQKLEEAGCLADSEHVIESHTRYKADKGLSAAPPAQYLRLDIERMAALVPELGRYLS